MSRLGCFVLMTALVGCQTTSPSHWAEQTLAQHELEAGRPKEAIRILEECKRQAPDYPLTYLTLAAAWAREGNADQFRDNLEKYLSLNPSHYVASLYLAEALFKEENWNDAKRAFEKYLEAETGIDPKALHRRQHALSRLADIAEKQNHPFEQHRRAAQALYQSALAEIALASSSSLPQEKRDELLNLLASATSEIETAQKLEPTNNTLERDLLAMKTLAEEVRSGQSEKLALLLTSAQPDAARAKAPSHPFVKLPTALLATPKE